MYAGLWVTYALALAQRAAPTGVMGVKTWMKIGLTPPLVPGELSFLSVETRAPHSSEYRRQRWRQMAHYMLRWINARGETEPWSGTVSTTIGA